MIVQRDLPVPMDDGLVLRADVFRPDRPGRFPVIMSLGLRRSAAARSRSSSAD
jgi:predicted acyl esterase